VMFLLGMKFYVYNALDVKLKFKFALAYKKANVLNTLDFFRKLQKVYPLKNGIKIVQTDNGSEYLGLFHKYLIKEGITHLFIYPRCPKINSFGERANRTSKMETFIKTSPFPGPLLAAPFLYLISKAFKLKTKKVTTIVTFLNFARFPINRKI